MFLSDGLRPAKESLGALRVGPRQPRRLSERSTRSTTVARNARTSGLSRSRRRSRRACIPGAFPEPLSATASSMGASPMAPRFYSQRNGEYVYDVTVTKDETVRPSHRYRAHLSNVQRLECGRLAHVQVDLQDTYGATVAEAVRHWRRASRRGVSSNPPNVSDVGPRMSMARKRRRPVGNGLGCPLALLGVAVLVARVLPVRGAGVVGMAHPVRHCESFFSDQQQVK